MSTQLDKAKAVARVRSATQPSVEVMCAIDDAFDRIDHGEFGEPANVGPATIEQFEAESLPAPIKLFISDAEEAVDYTPDEARKLAYELLAMAHLSEAFFDQVSDSDGRGTVEDWDS